jgi:hypothetical protein
MPIPIPDLNLSSIVTFSYSMYTTLSTGPDYAPLDLLAFGGIRDHLIQNVFHLLFCDDIWGRLPRNGHSRRQQDCAGLFCRSVINPNFYLRANRGCFPIQWRAVFRAQVKSVYLGICRLSGNQRDNHAGQKPHIGPPGMR